MDTNQSKVRVLVPTDGSECSLGAVRWALRDRASRAGTDYEIHLINVQPPLHREVTRFLRHDQVASFHRDESAKAIDAAETLLRAAGAPCVVHAEVGPIGETIADRADALGCDLIVMGTHGRAAIAGFLVGSVTVRTVHAARVPVVLVK